MRIYVATKNERKINLAKEVLLNFFPGTDLEVVGCEAKAEVSDTPWEEQTFQGAWNRARNAKKDNPDGDYFIGIETGLIERYGLLFEETWCCVVDKESNEFWAYSSGYRIPAEIQKRVLKDEKTNTKTLEIFNSESKTWEPYSGSTKIREVSLRSAIQQVFIQIIESTKI